MSPVLRENSGIHTSLIVDGYTLRIIHNLKLGDVKDVTYTLPQIWKCEFEYEKCTFRY